MNLTITKTHVIVATAIVSQALAFTVCLQKINSLTNENLILKEHNQVREDFAYLRGQTDIYADSHSTNAELIPSDNEDSNNFQDFQLFERGVDINV